ncbi:MAG: hypothetical protein IT204_11840 [Fimbriimonadaceae bacterium]|nr:hypothetical protein [Fimbriimonadaceae bacterium]
MPAVFVALDLVRPSVDRVDVAAVVRDEHGDRAVCWMIGYDPLAVAARAKSQDAETLAAASLDEVARGLLERAEGAPWLVCGLDDALATWRDADQTGVLDTTPTVDLGDLLALAQPASGARDLGAFALAAGLSETDQNPPRGLPTAERLVALHDAVPALVAARPAAVREEVGELLRRAGSPLAPLWAQGNAARRADEPLTCDALLRERLRELTPPAAEPRELPTPTPLEPAEVAAWLGQQGPVAAAMAAYEDRPGQLAMADAVATAFNEGHCLLVEAGTGTGKSIAYLAPALRWAVRNGTPVVVSTNTKNLQDQLCRKDLPLLQRCLPLEFRAELVKGRGNYLCVEKLLRELGDATLLPFEDQLWQLACVLSWATATASGDLDELPPWLSWRYPKLEGYARTLASDSESCTALSARNHPCFATVARRRAQEADLLVVNHALALANATTEVLPPFEYLVLDEAHNLEDIATEAFGLNFERWQLLRMVREVGPSRDVRSLNQRLRRLFESQGELGSDLLAVVTALEQAVTRVQERLEELGQQLGGLVMHRRQRTVEELTRSERLRLEASVYEGALGESLATAAENLRLALSAVVQELTRLTVGLQALSGEGDGDLATLRVQAQGRLQEWTAAGTTLDVLRSLTDPQYVYWLEFVLRRDNWEWRLRAAPIDPGRALADHLYAKVSAVVLTSATLTVNNRFDYFASRLGLRQPEVVDRFTHLRVPSGFDYQRQVLLALPSNIALPHEEPFERHCLRAVEEICRLLDGRTLVLYTAAGPMRRAQAFLQPRLAAIGIETLCQGVSGPRHVLAERFRRQEHSVLLGTRSFWEGIDVPGDALRCVVIVKLPFAVPDDPVHQARCEKIEAHGGDAWRSYSIPQAVILFKQGFGRLIRTATDRGAVICLDRRLLEKSYGQAFLRSVPGYCEAFDAWSQVKERVRAWFDQPSTAVRR